MRESREGRGCGASALPLRLLLLLSFLAAAAEGAKYAKMCELGSSPLVNLEYDAVTKQFSLIDNDASDEEEVRHLVEKKIVNIGRHIVSESNNYLRAKSRMLDSESANQASPDSKKTYIARSCPCDDSERTYCLLDGISEGTSVPDSCGVPWSDKFFEASYNSSDSSPTSAYYNNLEIGCFELNSQTVFTRNAWPVVVLWYGALLIFLLATSNGKYARQYTVHLLCPRLQSNERLVERILQRENEVRTRLRSAALVRARNVAEGPGRFLRRTPGVRIPNRDDWRDTDMTEEEERQEATRWWIEQAAQLGILRHEPQQMEYVLRTKTFNAEKERARRAQMRLMNSKGNDTAVEEDANDNAEQCCSEGAPAVSTPSKRDTNKDEEEGPSTPETVATALSANTTEFDNTEQLVLSASEEEDTFECTICITEIEEGDRVGILPCSHLFHADCLQQWITRKNACPLCQTELATSRPSTEVEDEGSSPAPLEDEEGESSERNSTSNANENRGNNNPEPDAEAQPRIMPTLMPTFLSFQIDPGDRHPSRRRRRRMERRAQGLW